MPILWTGSAAKRLSAIAFVALALSVACAGFRWSFPNAPTDFEECVDQAPSALGAQRTAVMTECGARFAGRRKPGGGYTYYDFMQNRIFEIAGPNPSPEERRYIDSEYMRFLDSERREVLSAELAQRQSEKLVASLDSLPSAEAPMVLLPKSPPAKQPIINRNKQCKMEGSLSCSWTKLKSAVRDAFASAIKPGSG